MYMYVWHIHRGISTRGAFIQISNMVFVYVLLAYYILFFMPSTLRGLTNSHQSLEVVFHVIIPKPHWKWDKTSKVFLRFGCEELGLWKANVGPFHERYVMFSHTHI